VSVPMTLSDLYPDFKVTTLFKSNISKRCVLWTKLLLNTNRKPYPFYRMAQVSMTLSDPDQDLKVVTFFDIAYLQHDTR